MGAVEEKEKEQEKNTFALLENTRKSLGALLDFNVTSKNKVVEAVLNTKTACKFMVREVTKKFEDFEAELENMDDSVTVDGEADYNENVKGKTKRLKTNDFDSEDSTHLEEANIIPENSQASKRKVDNNNVMKDDGSQCVTKHR